MDDFSTSGLARPGARARSDTATLLGQVMFLVAVALGFMTGGAFIGQDLSQGTAVICFLAGFGMLQLLARQRRLGRHAGGGLDGADRARHGLRRLRAEQGSVGRMSLLNLFDN